VKAHKVVIPKLERNHSLEVFKLVAEGIVPPPVVLNLLNLPHPDPVISTNSTPPGGRRRRRKVRRIARTGLRRRRSINQPSEEADGNRSVRRVGEKVAELARLPWVFQRVALNPEMG